MLQLVKLIGWKKKIFDGYDYIKNVIYGKIIQIKKEKMVEPKYKRILIKLSGEALADERGVGIIIQNCQKYGPKKSGSS